MIIVRQVDRKMFLFCTSVYIVTSDGDVERDWRMYILKFKICHPPVTKIEIYINSIYSKSINRENTFLTGFISFLFL